MAFKTKMIKRMIIKMSPQFNDFLMQHHQIGNFGKPNVKVDVSASVKTYYLNDVYIKH